ncbi:hypothetical protein BJ742DRAFT_795459 [Cladochytrium replicatum]|nr:hypothetical protein BJ742DRAFT_795459 [Cladochytrium replicatum]
MGDPMPPIADRDHPMALANFDVQLTLLETQNLTVLSCKASIRMMSPRCICVAGQTLTRLTRIQKKSTSNTLTIRLRRSMGQLIQAKDESDTDSDHGDAGHRARPPLPSGSDQPYDRFAGIANKFKERAGSAAVVAMERSAGWRTELSVKAKELGKQASSIAANFIEDRPLPPTPSSASSTGSNQLITEAIPMDTDEVSPPINTTQTGAPPSSQQSQHSNNPLSPTSSRKYNRLFAPHAPAGSPSRNLHRPTHSVQPDPGFRR